MNYLSVYPPTVTKMKILYTGLIYFLIILTIELNVSEGKESHTDELCKSNTPCIFLVQSGECTQNPSFMKRRCKDFCEKCKSVAQNSVGRSFGPNRTQTEPKPDLEHNCKDNPNSGCAGFAAEGDCQNEVAMMKRHCPETCEFCVFDKICLDRSKNCSDIVNNGMCESDPIRMTELCPKSCGKCDDLCLDMSKTCGNLKSGLGLIDCKKNATIAATCPLTCGLCGPAGLCLDNSKKCAQLTKDGECENNSTYMMEQCPLACGACGPDGLCLDKSKNCSLLAKRGECLHDSKLMTELCPNACGKCGDNGLCLDRNKKCHELEEHGDCESNANYMTEHCPVSCGKCDDDGFCLDRSTECSKLAANGDCQKDPKYMTETCPMSCNRCSGRAGGCKSHRFEKHSSLNNRANPFESGIHDNSKANYICRTNNTKGLLVGHATNNFGTWNCWTTWERKSVRYYTAEIFINPDKDNLKWISSDHSSFPNGAITGGLSPKGEPLILARCLQTVATGRHEVPGYVKQKSPDTAYYGFARTEYPCKKFEILTCVDRPLDQSRFCLDSNKKCAELAAAGECGKHSGVLIKDCPVSCGGCDLNGACKDRNKRCAELATTIGACDRNVTHMSETCPHSCNTCQNECEDKNYDCVLWVEAGKCVTHAALMKENCAKSCGFCKKIEVPTVPTTKE